MFGVSPGVVRAAVKEIAQLGLLDVHQRRPVVVRLDAAERAAAILSRVAIRRPARRVAIMLSDQFLPLRSNPFYAALSGAITREAARHGCHASLVPWPIADQISVARSLPNKGFDAAVFVGALSCYDGALHMMFEQGFPFLVFNRRYRGLPLPSVLLDTYDAGRSLAARLHGLGHKNMCLVAAPDSVVLEQPDPRKIPQGWLDYLQEANLLPHCVLPTHFPYDRHQAVFPPSFVDLMHSASRPTAIVFEYPQWAATFLRDPRFSDLLVPDDVSLAIMGSTRKIPSVTWSPPLTNAEVNYSRAAQCLIEMLQRLMAGETDVPSIRLQLTLHLTDSLGPVPLGRSAAAVTAPPGR